MCSSTSAISASTASFLAHDDDERLLLLYFWARHQGTMGKRLQLTKMMSEFRRDVGSCAAS